MRPEKPREISTTPAPIPCPPPHSSSHPGPKGKSAQGLRPETVNQCLPCPLIHGGQRGWQNRRDSGRQRGSVKTFCYGNTQQHDYFPHQLLPFPQEPQNQRKLRGLAGVRGIQSELSTRKEEIILNGQSYELTEATRVNSMKSKAFTKA